VNVAANEALDHGLHSHQGVIFGYKVVNAKTGTDKKSKARVASFVTYEIQQYSSVKMTTRTGFALIFKPHHSTS